MKLFVINLDRQPERLQRMAEVFHDLGLEFTRVRAVDGTQLTGDDIAHWGALRAGETACFLSHRECWRRVVEEDLLYAGIFEDDLHLAKGAARILGGGTWVPPKADVVKVETKLYPARIDKAGTATVDGRYLHRLRSRHAGAGGYVVTRKGAERLLQMSRGFEAPVDQFIFNPEIGMAASLITFQLVPAICIQDFVVKDPTMILGLGSDLHKERSEERLSGFEKLLREARRPFSQLAGFLRRKLSAVLTDNKWVVVDFR